MSDFDAALERLVSDPTFRTALANDPTAALAGYRLTPDEQDLLHSSIDSGVGGDRSVEQRTSKASMFGLLSSLAGMGGLGESTQGGGGSVGHADSGGSRGLGSVDSSAGQQRLGPAEATSGLGSQDQGTGDAQSALGQDDRSYGSGTAGGDVAASVGGDAAVPAGGDAAASAGGDAAASAGGDAAASAGGDAAVPAGHYHTRVDADGDGRWDRFTLVHRGAEGVDIVVDRDGDGIAEFVAHDSNRDGLIDYALTDENHDGQLDTRWVDDNGDGWLDRRVPFDLSESPQSSELGAPGAGVGAQGIGRPGEGIGPGGGQESAGLDEPSTPQERFGSADAGT
jgi:hypothetical protein